MVIIEKYLGIIFLYQCFASLSLEAKLVLNTEGKSQMNSAFPLHLWKKVKLQPSLKKELDESGHWRTTSIWSGLRTGYLKNPSFYQSPSFNTSSWFSFYVPAAMLGTVSHWQGIHSWEDSHVKLAVQFCSPLREKSGSDNFRSEQMKLWFCSTLL